MLAPKSDSILNVDTAAEMCASSSTSLIHSCSLSYKSYKPNITRHARWCNCTCFTEGCCFTPCPELPWALRKNTEENTHTLCTDVAESQQWKGTGHMRLPLVWHRQSSTIDTVNYATKIGIKIMDLYYVHILNRYMIYDVTSCDHI